ncbi:gamma-butyrobetaine dioxygenase-like [Agrilus planipennis]|uniref:Gamma-butyrobetaine dioxygenase-like n=1 Tax=Agrilus planipennis TaxID=224129 RepID=A0A1W4WQ40_AGRPL|nr:gamma-butyrobetaine dioxygenase-like [Agrilus planipennis]
MNIANSLKNIFASTNFNKLKFDPRRTLIKQAKVALNEGNLIVEFHDETEAYPSVWLRDNCTCPECFHNDSHSRAINWDKFDVGVSPISVDVNKDKLEIKWSDNHRSIFTEDWLRNRSFEGSKQAKYLEENYRPKKILWDGTEFTKILKTYSYREVMTKDEILYCFLKDLAIYGVVLLKDAPMDPSANSKLSQKIAFVRETHYGKEYVITSKPGTNNYAYLSSLLQQHTDLPYYEYNPGVVFLHYVVQTESEGGQNLLTDGFFVAEKMRREMKEHFELLSTVHVNWSDYGTEDFVKFCNIFRTPVISLDSFSEIASVRYSIPQRDSFFSVPLEKVTSWYHALKEFTKLLDKHCAKFKVESGNILVFDNTRLTHGRVQYNDTKGNQRYLVGNYMDWDEIYSKMRILKNEMQEKQQT